MSNPSFDNIDKWFFELSEGNLSESQLAQLEQFMLKNPHLDVDRDAWQQANVYSDNVVYPHTHTLIKRPVAWYTTSAVSAIALLTIGSALWIFTPKSSDTQFDLAARKMERSNVPLNPLGNSFLQSKSQFASSNKNKTIKESSIALNSLNNTESGVTIESNVSDFSNNVISYPIETSNFFNNNIEKREFLIATDTEIDPSLDTKSNLVQKKESRKIEMVGVKPIEKGEQLDPTLVSENSSKIKSETELSDLNATEVAESKLNANAAHMSRLRANSTYSKSFSNKVRSSVRKIIRMTDNPVALTNSKDIYYHVPGMQSLDVNFASTGSLLRPRLQSVSRLQWMGANQQQLTNQLSFDTYAKRLRAGIGVQVNQAHYGNGAYQIGQMAVTYSPKFQVSKNLVLEPAVRLKMGNKRLDNSKLAQGDMVELDRQNEQWYSQKNADAQIQDLWYRDIGFGMMANTKWFSAGMQIDNLGRHFNNVYNNSVTQSNAGYHLTATIGTDYVSRTKNSSFSPYLMYQKFEKLSEIWGGSTFRYKKLILGGGISSAGEYAGSVGIRTDRLMIGLNSDFTVSSLSNKKLFSHQLTVRILTNKGRHDQRMLNL